MKHIQKTTYLAALGSLFLSTAGSSANPGIAQALTVCASEAASCDYSGPGAVQRAIDAADSGAKIILREGVYEPSETRDTPYQDITVRGVINVEGKDLSLVGEPGVVIQGSTGKPATAIVVRDASVSMENLTISGFVAAAMEDDIYDGHGIFIIDGKAELENISIRGLPKMALSIRGDSQVDSDALTVSDGHIGVWIEETARLRLQNGYFSGNDSAAIAAYQDSQVTVDSSVFESNGDDGVYAAGKALIEVSGSAFINNTPYAARADDSARISIDTSYLKDNDINAATPEAAVSLGQAMLTNDPRGRNAGAAVEPVLIRDCETCPALTAIPSGEIHMGVVPAENLREPDQQPRHPVSISKPWAMGIHEVTREQFGRFVEETSYRAAGACNALDGVTWVLDEERDWVNPGYPQNPDHPVVCVSWRDAIAYVEWLSSVTGQTYRLPSETEWEYAARSGMPETAPINQVNRSRANHGTEECCGPLQANNDIWDFTAPVGSLEGNAFGLYDTQGNVWEWVADCYHDSYAGIPNDGSPRTADCSRPDYRVVRGGSWGDDSYYMLANYRLLAPADFGYFTLGFRVARDLPVAED
ncbi:SUMF1/EgtB/PvdO family nonheme iron enzyme [Parahaliea mediterranea]|uniref:SUMF1/EgtB/PvdO family nonheme iron enzyme n=1 Tax=Parahaliea mediterranea TaxID=651086 RepID=A0A939DF90_9GAMM|nr:SUMF1/EgtB/PvdO family nonheme iron enzyme [Parahaliea mediterranea]MBN7797195.1 SUMF1/EgtB/PvdO family nonheme iron enzyme [Parahaliea mediterranea]